MKKLKVKKGHVAQEPEKWYISDEVNFTIKTKKKLQNFTMT